MVVKSFLINSTELAEATFMFYLWKQYGIVTDQ
jgi:hypothetical protein